jgi:pyrroloquinoline quinone biosynthesis protein B
VYLTTSRAVLSSFALVTATIMSLGAEHGRTARGTQAVDEGWRVIVLGVAQDGGIPQMGCQRPVCEDVRSGRRSRARVSSLGLVNGSRGAAYLFDATPDFPSQVEALTGGRVPDGIFLTHAHIGHYTGLMYLGREVVNARGVPVYATGRMAAFLRSNGPWSQLVSLDNIALRTILYDVPVTLDGGITVTPFRVPHRDEYSDTVGYRLEGPRRSGLFIPDIDRWETWDRDIRVLANAVDYAWLDGTFASPSELNRPIEEIPHPMMARTRELLKDTRAALWFIHLNNSNAELDAPDVAREGMTFPL